MPLKHNNIPDWTQAQLNEQISQGNFPAGTTLNDIVLPSDWNSLPTYFAPYNASGYVPYTGATALVDLGANPLYASSLFVSDEGSGYGNISLSGNDMSLIADSGSPVNLKFSEWQAWDTPAGNAGSASLSDGAFVFFDSSFNKAGIKAGALVDDYNSHAVSWDKDINLYANAGNGGDGYGSIHMVAIAGGTEVSYLTVDATTSSVVMNDVNGNSFSIGGDNYIYVNATDLPITCENNIYLRGLSTTILDYVTAEPGVLFLGQVGIYDGANADYGSIVLSDGEYSVFDINGDLAPLNIGYISTYDGAFLGSLLKLPIISNPSPSDTQIWIESGTNHLYARLNGVTRQLDNAGTSETAYLVSTTNATVTTIATVAIPATTTTKMHIEVVARRTGGSAGTAEDGAGYEIVATYKNVAGTATLIGSVTTLHSAESQAGWDVTLTPSGGNVLVQVTGATNNNINWSATVALLQKS